MRRVSRTPNRRVSPAGSLGRRYRLDRLAEEGLVKMDRMMKGPNVAKFYTITDKGHNLAVACYSTNGIFGEIPEQASKEDLLTLTHELYAIRNDDAKRAIRDDIVSELVDVNDGVDDLEARLDERISKNEEQILRINGVVHHLMAIEYLTDRAEERGIDEDIIGPSLTSRIINDEQLSDAIWNRIMARS